MRKWSLSLSIFILLLAACTPDFPPPEKIDFENDPRILRGKWIGEATLEAPVTPLSYSPDGSRLLAVEGFEAAIYDTTTFDVVARLELDEGDTTDTAQFSLDNAVLVTTRRDIEADDVTVSRWNALTGEHLETLSFPGYPAGFSMDLSRLATLSNTQEQGEEITVWRMSDKSQLNSFKLPENYVNITLSPDFTTVAAAERNVGNDGRGDDTVFLWDLATQETLLEFTNSNSGSFRFSPDGSLLALKYSLRSFVHMWDVDAREFLFQSSDITGEVLTFNADGTEFATVNDRGNFLIRDTQDGTVLTEIKLASDRGTALLFSPQFSQVAVGRSDGGLRVLDLASNANLVEIAELGIYPISTDIEATYVNEHIYDLSGTLTFKGKMYTIRGKVDGGGEQMYLQPTRSLPSPASFGIEALNEAGEVRWILQGAPSRDSTFEGEIFYPESFTHEFSLERQP